MTESCGTCRFFHKMPSGVTVCRRYPKRSELILGGISPQTVGFLVPADADEWCGEYRSINGGKMLSIAPTVTHPPKGDGNANAETKDKGGEESGGPPNDV